MGPPEKHIPTNLEEALVVLKRDLTKAECARVEGIEVELRVVSPSLPAGTGLGDWMASAGPRQGESEDEMPTTKASDDVLNGATWHGEIAAELIQIIRDGREIDDPAEERPDRVESPCKIL